ncbi:Peptidase M48 [Corchorus olitorius]|uniref:Peptidase M48 n=1 Tax=Corchorus olitorius TaxID=93759 RepID=A0A1R3KYX8_9ROSI|nr:Peptidase M48 [Corchorus olitorius]
MNGLRNDDDHISANSILLSSDPRAIRVQSIARKLLDAMREGLMLQHQSKLVSPKSEGSKFLNYHHLHRKAEICGVTKRDGIEFNSNQESENRRRNLIWKPATKHLDGNVWEVYVANKYLNSSLCLHNGKIGIETTLLGNLKSDDEVAAVIAHEV